MRNSVDLVRGIELSYTVSFFEWVKFDGYYILWCVLQVWITHL